MESNKWNYFPLYVKMDGVHIVLFGAGGDRCQTRAGAGKDQLPPDGDRAGVW